MSKKIIDKLYLIKILTKKRKKFLKLNFSWCQSQDILIIIYENLLTKNYHEKNILNILRDFSISILLALATIDKNLKEIIRENFYLEEIEIEIWIEHFSEDKQYFIEKGLINE